jgi:hypothetical protein
MKNRKLIRIALAAAVAALAIASIPAMAGARDNGRDDRGRDDHGRHHEAGDDHGRHHEAGDDHGRDGRRGDDHGRHHGRHRGHIHHFRGAATGTISSFDATTGKLTIAASNGDTVSGLVTRGTEIKCEGFDDRFSRARRDHGGSDDNSGPGSGGSSNSGPGRGGESEPGDDHGGRGEEEPGDDHGNDGFENAPGAPICGTASLVPGAVVQEAELFVRGGTSFFDEIELAHTS